MDYDVFSMKMKMKMNENVLLGWLFCFVSFFYQLNEVEVGGVGGGVTDLIFGFGISYALGLMSWRGVSLRQSGFKKCGHFEASFIFHVLVCHTLGY